MYEVNLIRTGFPRVVIVGEGGFHIIVYLHNILSEYFSSNFFYNKKIIITKTIHGTKISQAKP